VDRLADAQLSHGGRSVALWGLSLARVDVLAVTKNRGAGTPPVPLGAWPDSSRDITLSASPGAQHLRVQSTYYPARVPESRHVRAFRERCPRNYPSQILSRPRGWGRDARIWWTPPNVRAGSARVPWRNAWRRARTEDVRTSSDRCEAVPTPARFCPLWVVWLVGALSLPRWCGRMRV
jgi:hypothetical protein